MKETNVTATYLEPGVWGILATPFGGQEGRVDTASLTRLVALYRRVGARGVVALGVLGEAARLDAEERALVLSTVVDAAQGLPVVAGMSALATAPAVEEARRAAELGARAVMVQVPTADGEALARHVETVADAAGLGIVLQDHPASTGIAVAPSALSQAVRASGVVVAIKA